MSNRTNERLINEYIKTSEENEKQIESIMRNRIDNVLKIFKNHGCDVLVLGGLGMWNI